MEEGQVLETIPAISSMVLCARSRIRAVSSFRGVFMLGMIGSPTWMVTKGSSLLNSFRQPVRGLNEITRGITGSECR